MRLEEAWLLMGRLRSGKLRDSGAHVWITLFNVVFELTSLCYNKNGLGICIHSITLAITLYFIAWFLCDLGTLRPAACAHWTDAALTYYPCPVFLTDLVTEAADQNQIFSLSPVWFQSTMLKMFFICKTNHRIRQTPCDVPVLLQFLSVGNVSRFCPMVWLLQYLSSKQYWNWWLPRRLREGKIRRL